MLVLGIESSCDETAAAIVEDGTRVLSNIVHSQIDIHAKYGGVVPEVAARNHIFWVDKVAREAIAQAGKRLEDINAVAVAAKVGLIGCVLVGESFAKGLALARNIPCVEVDHVDAHIAAGYLGSDLKPPFVALVVSGGHTALYDVQDYKSVKLLAATEDDAVGEAFDKVARVLALGYPGGAKIDLLSQSNAQFELASFYKKPRVANDDYIISYSGLKTAVINYVNSARQAKRDINVEGIASTFSKDAFDSLIDYSIHITKKQERSTLLVCGGVAANSYLRSQMHLRAQAHNIRVEFPPIKYCGDNGAMIAAQGFFKGF